MQQECPWTFLGQTLVTKARSSPPGAIRDMESFLNPRAIAVFGASDSADSVGGRVFRNLMDSGYRGALYAVNPKHKQVMGTDCHPDLKAIGHAVDLAVVATPARAVAGIIRQCGERGTPAAIVLSAGFAETGAKGRALEEQVVDLARKQGVRILGPNCLGLIRPAAGINATFSNGSALAGDLALVSQSGAVVTAVLDWAQERNLGFSAMVSLGNAGDVDFGDVLDYLALDRKTRSILLYVEGIQHSRGFMSALRAAARVKPVIVVKAGRNPAGSAAAISHSAALVSGDDVFSAAVERAGAIRVRELDGLFAAAAVLGSGARALGNRLAIVTNAGGLGVLATDRLGDMGRLALAALDPRTVKRLDRLLPDHWSHDNPVDILGDADPKRYQQATALCLDDPGVDGVLVLLTPQAVTDPLGVAREMTNTVKDQKKPVLMCWMGGAQVAAARELFQSHCIPHFETPESAVEAFSHLAEYCLNQKLLMQVPGPLGYESHPDTEGARMIIQGVLEEGRTTLSLTESKAVLAAFGIEVARSVETHSANEALVAAESLGFPVALKVSSPDITHKSDVGGVRLNLATPQAVRTGYGEVVKAVAQAMPDARIGGVTVERMARVPNARELMVGIARDPAFGPTISFGAGGVTVEIMGDQALALPPLNRFIIRNLVSRTRVSAMLGTFRNLPAIDMTALETLLLRVSEMACELPELVEMDLNPVMADHQGVLVVDARIVAAHPPPGTAPYAHMAIYPYPSHLVSEWQLADGTNIQIRPIRPEDASIERDFVNNLSQQSKYFRFMQNIGDLSDTMLIRFTQIDYDREMALIAVVAEDGGEREIAVARYAINPDGRSCEFAIVVGDEWQGHGLGTRLMTTLMEAARARGLATMTGDILANNRPMLDLVKSLGFRLTTNPEDPVIRQAEKQL